MTAPESRGGDAAAMAATLAAAVDQIEIIKQQLEAISGSVRWPSIMKSDGLAFIVTDKHVEELKRQFPMVDVESELRRAADWCYDHPARRKKNVMYFLRNWMRSAEPVVQPVDPYAGLRQKGGE